MRGGGQMTFVGILPGVVLCALCIETHLTLPQLPHELCTPNLILHMGAWCSEREALYLRSYPVNIGLTPKSVPFIDTHNQL